MIGYLMAVNEFSFEEAFDYVKTLRPTISPNQAFIAQLHQYDQILRQQREMADNCDADRIVRCSGPAEENVSASSSFLGMNAAAGNSFLAAGAANKDDDVDKVEPCILKPSEANKVECTSISQSILVEDVCRVDKVIRTVADEVLDEPLFKKFKK